MRKRRQNALRRLDTALLALRRVTSLPASPDVAHAGGARVELSTLLVVDALARHPTGYGCSIGDVAEALTVTHSTASRLVDRAVRAGAVTRGRDPDEARRARLELTALGRQLHADAVRFRTSRLAALTTAWSDDDVATLTRLLERFAADAAPHLSLSHLGTGPPEGSPS